MSTETTGQLSGLDPGARAFLEKMDSLRAPPFFKMSAARARKALSDLQASTPVPMMPAEVREIDIPGGPTGHVRAHIVRPQGREEALSVTLYYHGGGWVLGGFDTHERLVRDLANKTNAAVVFVDYPLSPGAKYPVITGAGYRALEYIADNGPRYNLDSSRLAVAGDSVGGNMATVLSMMAKEHDGPDIALQVLIYPVTDAGLETGSFRRFATGLWLERDEMKLSWDNYLPDKAARKEPMASPLRASTDQLKGLPPALVITCEYDVLRDEGEAYAHKLISAGVPTTAVRFLGTIHDLVMLNALADTPAAKSAVEMTCDGLRYAFAP
ncbi:MAG TPA: alpha/beta hydrolase [Methanocella sp.]